MDKKVLRQQVIARLKALTPTEKMRRDQRLTECFLKSSAYKSCQILAVFLSMDFEFDTSSIITRAQKDGKTICVPKTYAEGQMTFLLYNEENLVVSQFGVKEPSQGEVVEHSDIDLILVPGLAWNQEGYRIGFGGGFYDRYLSDYEGRTISLVYDFQKIDFKAELHDVAIQEVIYEME